MCCGLEHRERPRWGVAPRIAPASAQPRLPAVGALPHHHHHHHHHHRCHDRRHDRRHCPRPLHLARAHGWRWVLGRPHSGVGPGVVAGALQPAAGATRRAAALVGALGRWHGCGQPPLAAVPGARPVRPGRCRRPAQMLAVCDGFGFDHDCARARRPRAAGVGSGTRCQMPATCTRTRRHTRTHTHTHTHTHMPRRHKEYMLGRLAAARSSNGGRTCALDGSVAAASFLA